MKSQITNHKSQINSKFKILKSKTARCLEFGAWYLEFVWNLALGIWNLPRLRRGFTLVEMIVALGFFTIVMLIVISVLTSVAGANEKGRTMRIVIDNLNFSVENMARALRVGSRYHCGDTGTPLTNTQDCATGDSFIAFRNIQAGNVTTVFELDNGAVYRTNLDLDGGCASGDCTPLRLTAPEINVDSLVFYTKGSGEVDGAQAQILMITRGTAGRGPVQTDFDIQTTITQRLADS